MTRKKYIPALLLTAILMVVTGCSHSDEPVVSRPTAVLNLRISLDRPVYPGSRAAGDELPADDGERMQTVRIIITDSDGYAEHNSLWDLTAAPDIEATGQDYIVKSQEWKTIILVANERSATLRLSNGTAVNAGDYFGSIDAATGTKVDAEALKTLTMTAADNAADGPKGSIASPLAMSAIHRYYIGADEHYSATFNIHRAAVKYLFRFTNSDSAPHTVADISIGNAASRQYFFPDFDFTGPSQDDWTDYRTPDASGTTLTWGAPRTVEPRGTVEIGPFYLPEGHRSAATAPYSVGFTVDNIRSGMMPLKYEDNQGTEVTMTDLPRNTYVIVNVSMTFDTFEITYAVCPWDEKEIDIPEFN